MVTRAQVRIQKRLIPSGRAPSALDQEASNVKRIIALLLATVAVSAVASAAVAAPQLSHPKVAKKAVTAGFYRGQSVGYFDFGPIKLKPGNKLAPIWTITNAAPGQHNIIDTVPGRPDYSPLWQVDMVTFKQGVAPYLLKSKAEVDAAVAKGDVTVTKTSTVVNCPVLGFGQKRIAGFSGGETIHYYDLGPVKVAPGNAVVPLYAPTNGVPGQHNITGDTIAPGTTDYPPLWGIVQVTWKPGAHKRLLTSFAQIQQAKAAGELTLHQTPLVVDCPLVP
jgi:hypothetical protein